MKVLALALVMMSGTAIADVPEIVAKNVSCSKLKAEVEKYGSATIIKKALGIKKRYYVHHSVSCSSDERKVYGEFKTKTNKNCQVGQWCKTIWSIEVEGGGGYYDGGYSGGGYYDGSSSSGSSSSGSNYNPPSSGSTGSNYNPPSSGSTGSNYNPPSSGTQGPRYCPGC